MTTHPETAADIAAELVRNVVSTGVISAPVKSASGEDSGTLVQPDEASEILAARAKKIRIRHLAGSPEPKFQTEFFIAQKTIHRNLSEQETATLIEACFSGMFSRGYFSTADGDRSVMLSKKGLFTVVFKARPGNAQGGTPTGQTCCGITGSPPTETTPTHDRVKQRILPEGTPVPFLIDLGVMNAEGIVHKSKYPKYRQINRFLEFIADILPQLRELSRNKGTVPLRIVDFGCGKSYLTFALYHYLAHVEHMPVSITGLDLKKDVIDHCSVLARTYQYDNLSFAVGDIAGYTDSEPIDMVVSLHACDTATDLALARAVQWKAPVIFAVPCCQHELNSQLSSSTVRKGTAKTLAPLLRHGLIRERFAALLTDTLRAELLESAGYQVQLVEFIDMSHTPKNILIRATRKNTTTPDANRSMVPSQSYNELVSLFGITPTLERELFPDRSNRNTSGKD